jgi:hypothetical protein
MAATASRGRASGTARDPFAPPSGRAATSKKKTASAAKAKSTGTTASKSATTSAGGGSSATASPTPTRTTTTPAATGSAARTTPALTIDNASVDIRFAASAGGRVHRAIPRLQPYYIHGKLAAVFVKYSPSRHKAVFAIAPGLTVSGPVKCRRQNGVCRYVDIPAGSYARLTMVVGGSPVKRRLDVERIAIRRSGSTTTATAASDRSERACLLNKLKSLKPGGTPIDRDACA